MKNQLPRSASRNQNGRNRKKLGQDGETMACGYLKRKGYSIITRNFRCRNGEIDIIAQDKKTIVFCEVKARNNRKFGEPFEAVNKCKQLRLRRLAEGYLQRIKNEEKSIQDYNYRFDVVSIVFSKDRNHSITHIENAF